MVVLLWVLNAVVGWFFAMRIWLDFRKRKCRLTFCMLLVFLCFGTGTACIGAALLASSSDDIAVWIWRISILCLFLLALPVFFKYVVVYRGAYLEGGIMLSLFISGILCQSVLYLALVSMVSMGMLNFGCYEWLHHNVRMPSK